MRSVYVSMRLLASTEEEKSYQNLLNTECDLNNENLSDDNAIKVKIRQNG